MKARSSKKIVLISSIAMILIAGIVIAILMGKNSEDEGLLFKDPALESAIREMINKPTGKIVSGDVDYLTALVARDKGIESLSGLEHLHNLVVLDLRDNHISDLMPIKGLVKLKEINLRNNLIRDLSPLQQLGQLSSLNIRDNYIADVAPLGGLPLKDVNLRNNRIADVAPLASLASLKDKLYLQGNPIRDYSPLNSIQSEATDYYTERFSGIPEVHIDTNGIAVESQTERIPGTMTIRNSATSNYPVDGLYQGKIGIRGRGNSSWEAPKKPFNVELWSEQDQEKDAQILDIAEEQDWLLIPNYFDKSLIRNEVAFELARRIGMLYVPDSRYADVYLNGEYQGLYMIVESVKRDDNRVGVKKLTDSPADQTMPGISGGYILKVDRLRDNAADKKDEPYYTTVKGKVNVQFHDPSTEEMTDAQESYIAEYLDQFENALYGDQFADPDTGYRQFIDVDSFIDWFLIRELARDVDAWSKSTYMYKDRNNKLSMGPVWDFDIAFGNANYDDAWKTEGWSSILSISNSWYARLFEDEQFVGQVIERWKELKPIIDNIPKQIDETVLSLGNAPQRNFVKWPIIGKYVWPNVEPYPDSYQGEVDRLKEWIVARAAWIDQNIEGLLPE